MAGGEGGPNAGFIARAHKVFLVFGALYGAFLLLACIPYVQKQYVVYSLSDYTLADSVRLIYCHWIRVPLFPDYDHPEAYGLARTCQPSLH